MGYDDNPRGDYPQRGNRNRDERSDYGREFGAESRHGNAGERVDRANYGARDEGRDSRNEAYGGPGYASQGQSGGWTGGDQGRGDQARDYGQGYGRDRSGGQDNATRDRYAQ